MSDSRYSISQEYCGYPLPRWVVRFCGDWVGSAHSRIDAILMAAEHGTARQRVIAALAARP